MLCRRCIRASSRWATGPSTTQPTPAAALATSTRFFTTSSPLTNAAPTPASNAQPLSTSLTPSPSKSSASPSASTSTTSTAEKKTAAPLVKSSVPAGTQLKGLNFLKNKEDPVAMEDSAYPAWLWTILQRQEAKKEGAAGAAGDLFSKSKKQRRLAAKRLRKEQLANPDLLVPKVPVYEQTIDLPAGDGTPEGAVQAAKARDELRKALRDKRRAKIKEGNFLKAMG